MSHVFRIDEVAADDGSRAPAEVAEATRLGFVGADLLPGLPAPDGALETPAEVERDLARGARIWLARDDAGSVIGAVRAVPSAPAGWELRRLAVVPAWRGHGVARALVRRLEREAARAAVAQVWLNAVVERGNPIVYARLGYRTTAHWPSDDKLLSEVTMERDPRRRARAFRHPREGDDGERPSGPVLVWSAGDGALVVRLAEDRAAAMESPALGADLLCGGGPADGNRLRSMLVAAGGRAHDDAVWFASAPSDVRAFCMPRELDDRLLALWRLAPAPDGYSAVEAHTRRA